ncbi:hypothetical protein CAPTEDRAFT_207652 [Capitella teleta]|uniref:Uncharacterized protein n=1 Tax=Capitella teleta TaxID=283909 RepID=R7UTM4_CAPTE|nr:hypothetical protein CAPTEDRAFT_207652 [Capitella teleta]|eukprot:ELU09869.1 hypothetical protein CAPTEDRAFT_207652 [Capitella teleta]
MVTILWILGALLGCAFGVKFDALKCCAPEVWEARIVNTGTTNRQKYSFNNMDISFAYDLPNDRWAIDQVHPVDESKNLKLVFDYNLGKKYAINTAGCFVEPLDAHLNPYCIGKNATFLGEFGAGLPRHGQYHRAWSYDIFMFPLRHTLVVSKEHCLPIKEVTYSLIQNSRHFFNNAWAWNHGEFPCNPWEEPGILELGECFKSHRKIKKEVQGTQPTAFVLNMDYVDLNTTITNEGIFQVPEQCPNDSWDSVKLTDFWRILIMRMKFYDEVKDAPGLD